MVAFTFTGIPRTEGFQFNSSRKCTTQFETVLSFSDD